MKVKCPWCGARGTDVRPSIQGVTGPSGEPIHRKGQEDYAFEVRGNYAHRPVRKCLNCGNGVRITFLPPRYHKVSPEEWEYLQGQWTLYKAQEREYFDRLDAERERARPVPEDEGLGTVTDYWSESSGWRTLREGDESAKEGMASLSAAEKRARGEAT